MLAISKGGAIVFWLFLGSVIAISTRSSAFDKLPIGDGAYMRSTEYCQRFKAGELDMIEFSIETDGREFGFPEVGCYVATVQQLRPNRYAVEADCLELGNPPSQRTVVLDLVDPRTIQVNGRVYVLCDLGPTSLATISSEAAQPVKPSVGSPRELIEDWELANEDCRGGFGDDPATQKACNLRDVVAEQLEKAGWCFGKKIQSHSAYRWHKCMKDSIHLSQ